MRASTSGSESAMSPVPWGQRRVSLERLVLVARLPAEGVGVVTLAVQGLLTVPKPLGDFRLDGEAEQFFSARPS